MFSVFRSMALLVLCASLAVACAGTRNAADPPVKSAAPAQSAPQSLNANKAASAPAPADDIDASLVKAGYSVMRRHGAVLYCRNEIITGQRIASRVCLTAGQIQDEKQNVDKAKDVLSHPGDRCTKPMCVP